MFSKVTLICVSPDALVALIIRSNMNFAVFYKILLLFVSFVALVAVEWPLHGMRPHVALQITSCSASIVALVTFERLFSGLVLSHDVNFQINSLNARILAHCASMWLFTSVRLLVSFQVARLCCFVFTLIAIK